jgi:catechol 2,3-dioxygenase-like lactoylglutathione lyase family enzyme
MTTELNHLIIPARDKNISAAFLARILGAGVGQPWGPFLPVRVGPVTLDFEDAASGLPQMHLAFLVSDAEFDAALGRLREAGAAVYADPFRQQPGDINHLYGGRGVYFDDPDGHYFELITAPYGPVPEAEPPRAGG